jgi:hypothetical protein
MLTNLLLPVEENVRESEEEHKGTIASLAGESVPKQIGGGNECKKRPFLTFPSKHNSAVEVKVATLPLLCKTELCPTGFIFTYQLPNSSTRR